MPGEKPEPGFDALPLAALEMLSEKAFRDILDHLRQPVSVTPLAELVYVNPAFAELFGYDDPADILALDSAAGLYADDDFELVCKHHAACLRGEAAPSEYVVRGLRRDGSTVWLLNRPRRIDWPSGAVVCNTSIDMTRQIEAEVARQTSEEDYQRLFENTPQGIYRTTLDGRYVEANPALAAMMKFDDVETMKRSLIDFSRQVYVRPSLRRRLIERLKTGPVRDFEAEWRCADGSHIWVSVSAVLVEDPGRGESFVEGSVIDITEKREAELRLIGAKEQAELASRAKSDFLAHMSHELRTPLNCVIGFSQILMEEMFGAIGNDNYRSYAKDINVAGNHLLRLISDILDISKIEAGEVEISDETVDVGDLLVICMNMVRERADASGIIIGVEFDAELPRIRADGLRIQQIILNLFSNAVKFTPRGGRIIGAASLNDDGGMAIKISDDGVGISPQDIERVVAPFEQIREHHTVSHEGTGLGLYLSKMLTAMHGGRFEIESTVGAGTRVTVNLPAARTLT